MQIKIEKPTDKDLETKGVLTWPIWEKEISRFDWHYDSAEECYLLKGSVVVETKDGEKKGWRESGIRKRRLYYIPKRIVLCLGY